MAESFLAVDGILDLFANVSRGLVVYPKVIARRLASELPFMASENIMMDGVKAGGDRQELHEVIRENAQAAAAHVKLEGGENDLLERLAKDPHFAGMKLDLGETLRPEKYVGRAPEQVREYLAEVVDPFLQANAASAVAGNAVQL